MSTTEKESPAPDVEVSREAIWPDEGETLVFNKEEEEYVEADAVDERSYRDDRAFSGHERIGKIRAQADPAQRGRFSEMTEERKEQLKAIASGKTPLQVQAQAQLDAVEEQEKADAEAEKAAEKKKAAASKK